MRKAGPRRRPGLSNSRGGDVRHHVDDGRLDLLDATDLDLHENHLPPRVSVPDRSLPG
jgi:hypothetical protein